MKLWLVFLLGFIFSLALVAGLTWILAAYEAKTWAPWNQDPRLTQAQLFEIIRNAVTAGAALGVGITLFFSYRRQQTAEKTQIISAEAQRTAAQAQAIAAKALKLGNKQHRLDQDRRRDGITSELRTRYSRAAEQLGSDKHSVQIAGIYAMATLADDWMKESNTTDRQTCIDTLLGFYRMNNRSSRSSESEIHYGDLIQTTVWQTISTRFALPESNPWYGANINASGLRAEPPILKNLKFGAKLDLSNGQWPESSIDFSDLTITSGRLDLNNCHARSLRFFRCRLEGGTIDLDTFTAKDRVVFQRCHFLGTSIDFDFILSTPNIEFINCTFDAPLGDYDSYRFINKVKFVDCTINVEVFDERDLGAFNIDHVRIVRGCKFAADVRPLANISATPEDIDYAKEMKGRLSND